MRSRESALSQSAILGWGGVELANCFAHIGRKAVSAVHSMWASSQRGVGLGLGMTKCPRVGRQVLLGNARGFATRIPELAQLFDRNFGSNKAAMKNLVSFNSLEIPLSNDIRFIKIG